MTTCAEPLCMLPAEEGKNCCLLHRLQALHRDLASQLDARYYPHEVAAHLATVKLCEVVAQLVAKVNALEKRIL